MVAAPSSASQSRTSLSQARWQCVVVPMERSSAVTEEHVTVIRALNLRSRLVPTHGTLPATISAASPRRGCVMVMMTVLTTVMNFRTAPSPRVEQMSGSAPLVDVFQNHSNVTQTTTAEISQVRT